MPEPQKNYSLQIHILQQQIQNGYDVILTTPGVFQPVSSHCSNVHVLRCS